MPCRFGDATVTVTPGKARPWESLTCPEIVPVVLCAFAMPADRTVAKTTSPTLLNPIDFLPAICCVSLQYGSGFPPLVPDEADSSQLCVEDSNIRPRQHASRPRRMAKTTFGRTDSSYVSWRLKRTLEARSRAESLQQFERELVEVIDHQLSFEELRGGITVRDRDRSQASILG